MRLGCCGSIEDAPDVLAAGFDFLEVNVQTVLRGEEADADWAAPNLEGLGLPIEAANCLVPGHLKVVGPGRDLDVLKRYMERVAKRARTLGIGLLVFGSGAARKRPDGVGEQEANEQIADFLRMAGDVCSGHGIEVAVEHLCRRETNTVNTLAELKTLIDQVGHPHIGALVDSYHYGVELEDVGGIAALGGAIRHVHVAEPVGRVQPGAKGAAGESDDAFDFASFFEAIRQAGYQGSVSVEAHWTNGIASDGQACVRGLWEAWQGPRT